MHIIIIYAYRSETAELQKQFMAEFNKNQPVLCRVSKAEQQTGGRKIFKPANMTTAKAIKSGRTVERAIARAKTGSMTAKALKETVRQEPFKGVSVFIDFFGENWQMIKRIAMDPAHELYNLVKDILALVLSVKAMNFKPKRLEEEKKLGRFSNLQTTAQAPWIVGDRMRAILSQLLRSNKLRIPYGWPKLLDYFSDDYQKIKIGACVCVCVFEVHEEVE